MRKKKSMTAPAMGPVQGMGPLPGFACGGKVKKMADGGYIEDQVARRPDVRQAQASEKGWKTGTLSANFQTEHGEGAGPVNPKSISMGEARDVLKYDGKSEPRRYADGGMVGCHNPDNKLPKHAMHTRGRNRGL